MHKILNEELTLSDFDIIENDNINYFNLAKDGLHLNEGGTRKYTGSLSKFMRYGHCSSVNDSNKSRPMRKRNGLKIAFLNIVSLCKRGYKLSVLLHENNIDAIGLCETRLDNKVTDLIISIAGYRAF